MESEQSKIDEQLRCWRLKASPITLPLISSRRPLHADQRRLEEDLWVAQALVDDGHHLSVGQPVVIVDRRRLLRGALPVAKVYTHRHSIEFNTVNATAGDLKDTDTVKEDMFSLSRRNATPKRDDAELSHPHPVALKRAKCSSLSATESVEDLIRLELEKGSGIRPIRQKHG